MSLATQNTTRIHSGSPSEQIDAEYAWVTWITAFQTGMASAKPVLRNAGILGDQPTTTENYRIPLPPLGVGDDEEGTDGNEWGVVAPQTYQVEGLVRKIGPKGLKFVENDLYENRVSAISMNMVAQGNTLGMWEDRQVAHTVLGESGFKTEERTKAGIRKLTCSDGEPLFSRKHRYNPLYQDKVPSGDSNLTSNIWDLPLTPDALLEIEAWFGSIKDEVGNPVFGNTELKLALVVPTRLKSDANKAVKRRLVGEYQGGGGAAVDNVAFDIAEPIVLAQLRDPARWYVVVTNMAIKPVYRIGLKAMTPKEVGPGSDTWELKQVMKRWYYERADYRAFEWRLWATSKRK